MRLSASFLKAIDELFFLLRIYLFSSEFFLFKPSNNLKTSYFSLRILFTFLFCIWSFVPLKAQSQNSLRLFEQSQEAPMCQKYFSQMTRREDLSENQRQALWNLFEYERQIRTYEDSERYVAELEYRRMLDQVVEQGISSRVFNEEKRVWASQLRDEPSNANDSRSNKNNLILKQKIRAKEKYDKQVNWAKKVLEENLVIMISKYSEVRFQTYLHHALDFSKPQPRLVRALFILYNASELSSNETDFFYKAVATRSEYIIQQFLDARWFDQNENNLHKYLHIVSYDHDIDILKKLIKEGADLQKIENGDIEDPSHDPFLNAIDHGQIKVIKYLLTSGWNINASGDFGKSYLFYIVKSLPEDLSSRVLDSRGNHYDLVKSVIAHRPYIIFNMFLDLGLNPFDKTDDGKSLEEFAKNKKIKKFILKVKLEYARKHGLNHSDPQISRFFQEVNAGNVDQVEELLNSGINPFTKNRFGFEAVSFTNDQQIIYLIQKAKLNYIRINGFKDVGPMSAAEKLYYQAQIQTRKLLNRNRSPNSVMNLQEVSEQNENSKKINLSRTPQSQNSLRLFEQSQEAPMCQKYFSQMIRREDLSENQRQALWNLFEYERQIRTYEDSERYVAELEYRRMEEQVVAQGISSRVFNEEKRVWASQLRDEPSNANDSRSNKNNLILKQKIRAKEKYDKQVKWAWNVILKKENRKIVKDIQDLTKRGSTGESYLYEAIRNRNYRLARALLILNAPSSYYNPDINFLFNPFEEVVLKNIGRDNQSLLLAYLLIYYGWDLESEKSVSSILYDLFIRSKNNERFLNQFRKIIKTNQRWKPKINDILRHMIFNGDSPNMSLIKAILEEDWGQQDKKQILQSYLFRVIDLGDFELIRLFIEHGAVFNAFDLLKTREKYGHKFEELIQEVVDSGKNPFGDLEYLLLYANKLGVYFVKSILKVSWDQSQKQKIVQNYIYEFIKVGDIELIKLIMNYGANLKSWYNLQKAYEVHGDKLRNLIYELVLNGKNPFQFLPAKSDYKYLKSELVQIVEAAKIEYLIRNGFKDVGPMSLSQKLYYQAQIQTRKLLKRNRAPNSVMNVQEASEQNENSKKINLSRTPQSQSSLRLFEQSQEAPMCQKYFSQMTRREDLSENQRQALWNLFEYERQIRTYEDSARYIAELEYRRMEEQVVAQGISSRVFNEEKRAWASQLRDEPSNANDRRHILIQEQNRHYKEQFEWAWSVIHAYNPRIKKQPHSLTKKALLDSFLTLAIRENNFDLAKALLTLNHISLYFDPKKDHPKYNPMDIALSIDLKFVYLLLSHGWEIKTKELVNDIITKHFDTKDYKEVYFDELENILKLSNSWAERSDFILVRLLEGSKPPFSLIKLILEKNWQPQRKQSILQAFLDNIIKVKDFELLKLVIRYGVVFEWLNLDRVYDVHEKNFEKLVYELIQGGENPFLIEHGTAFYWLSNAKLLKVIESAKIEYLIRNGFKDVGPMSAAEKLYYQAQIQTRKLLNRNRSPNSVMNLQEVSEQNENSKKINLSRTPQSQSSLRLFEQSQEAPMCQKYFSQMTRREDLSENQRQALWNLFEYERQIRTYEDSERYVAELEYRRMLDQVVAQGISSRVFNEEKRVWASQLRDEPSNANDSRSNKNNLILKQKIRAKEKYDKQVKWAWNVILKEENRKIVKDIQDLTKRGFTGESYLYEAIRNRNYRLVRALLILNAPSSYYNPDVDFLSDPFEEAVLKNIGRDNQSLLLAYLLIYYGWDLESEKSVSSILYDLFIRSKNNERFLNQFRKIIKTNQRWKPKINDILRHMIFNGDSPNMSLIKAILEEDWGQQDKKQILQNYLFRVIDLGDFELIRLFIEYGVVFNFNELLKVREKYGHKFEELIQEIVDSGKNPFADLEYFNLYSGKLSFHLVRSILKVNWDQNQKQKKIQESFKYVIYLKNSDFELMKLFIQNGAVFDLDNIGKAYEIHGDKLTDLFYELVNDGKNLFQFLPAISDYKYLKSELVQFIENVKIEYLIRNGFKGVESMSLSQKLYYQAQIQSRKLLNRNRAPNSVMNL